uniref:Uncharacterized protein n=1 Tax=Steinernema glaseri TaxID=37863 RepID=A0A1I7YYP5_9BILA
MSDVLRSPDSNCLDKCNLSHCRVERQISRTWRGRGAALTFGSSAAYSAGIATIRRKRSNPIWAIKELDGTREEAKQKGPEGNEASRDQRAQLNSRPRGLGIKEQANGEIRDVPSARVPRHEWRYLSHYKPKARYDLLW